MLNAFENWNPNSGPIWNPIYVLVYSAYWNAAFRTWFPHFIHCILCAIGQLWSLPQRSAQNADGTEDMLECLWKSHIVSLILTTRVTLTAYISLMVAATAEHFESAKEAASSRLHNVCSHRQNGVHVDTEVTIRRWRGDNLGANPDQSNRKKIGLLK